MKLKQLLTFALALICALCCTLTLAACGKDDENPQETQDIVLTEDTDYSALVGEKVTEDGWKAAFAASAKARSTAADNAYDNVTIKHINKDEEDGNLILEWKKSGPALISISADDGEMSAPIQFIQDNGRSLTVITICDDPAEQNEYTYYETVYDKTDPSLAEEVELFGNTIMTYTYACPDFSEYFQLFGYDETLKAYTYDYATAHNSIRTNDIFMGGGQEWWDFAAVKIINGRLAFVRAGNYESDLVWITPTVTDPSTGEVIQQGVYERKVKESLKIAYDTEQYFYNFGVTEITLPACTLKKSGK